MNDKYLVYKALAATFGSVPDLEVPSRDEWDRGNTHDELLPGELVDDAVVIRLKDPFAATALYTYANTIMSFMELMRDMDLLPKEEAMRLLDIVDYFNSQADQSTKISGKRLPD